MPNEQSAHLHKVHSPLIAGCSKSRHVTNDTSAKGQKCRTAIHPALECLVPNHLTGVKEATQDEGCQTAIVTHVSLYQTNKKVNTLPPPEELACSCEPPHQEAPQSLLEVGHQQSGL